MSRPISSHQIFNRLNEKLDHYFEQLTGLSEGLPTVSYLTGQLNITPDYLCDLVKASTGLTTQQYIHHKLIENAKKLLSTTDLSIGEIACQLGFEYTQSFNKFFKKNTDLSPVTFRKAFTVETPLPAELAHS